ncbi:MAG: restriction endonuclease subunit S [Candidatus Omnitrophota bacterium]
MCKKTLDKFTIMQYLHRMQNKKKLKDIADVIAGYTFRGAIKENSDSSLHVLQAKNIKEDLFVNDDLLARTAIDTSHTKAFAKDGDVVIGARGLFRSAIVRSTKKILASSSVYLLRVKQESSVLPEYLVIYFNSSFGRKNIAQVVTGAAIKLILKKDLENIEIPILPIMKQQQMRALYQNLRKQEKLLIRKNKLQKNIMDATIKNIARG